MAISYELVDKIVNSRFNRCFLKIQRLIMGVTTIILLVILAAVVLFRYVLYSDIYGYDEFLICAAFWMYFIGAVYAMQEGSHVRADIVGMCLKPIPRMKLKIFAGVLQILVGCALTYLAINLICRAMVTKQISVVWEIPFVIYQLPILLGFLFMTYYMVIELLRDICDLHKLEKAEEVK